MNASEKEFILSNKDELIDKMRPSVQLNAYLEAKKFLSKGDLEKIEAETTNSGKSLSLVNILVGQTGGFQGLINALDKTGQTGALAILKQYKPGPLVSQPLVPQSAGTISESEIMKSADSVQVGGPDRDVKIFQVDVARTTVEEIGGAVTACRLNYTEQRFIRSKMKELVDTTPINEGILQCLESRQLLTNLDREEILKTAGTVNQTRRLYDKMMQLAFSIYEIEKALEQCSLVTPVSILSEYRLQAIPINAETIGKAVSVWGQNETLEIIARRWKMLARELGLKEETTAELDERMKTEGLSTEDVIMDILKEWNFCAEEEPTLHTLAQRLSTLGWMKAARELVILFGFGLRLLLISTILNPFTGLVRKMY